MPKANAVETNRRQLLKTFGVTGASLALAGCTGDSGGDSGQTTETSGDAVRTLEYVTLSESVHPIRFTWTQMHTERLRELGFDIDFQALSIPDYIERGFNQRSFDLYPLRYLDGFDPSGPLYLGFHSDSTAEGGGNCSLFRSDEFDRLYEEQAAAVNPAERQQIVYEIQEMLMEKQVITPVMVQNRKMPYNKERVQNPTSMLEYGLGSVYNFLSLEPAAGNDSNSLVFSVSEDLTTLNPLNPERGRAERMINRIVYDRLMRISPDTARPEPWMAESIDTPNDTTKIVTLREGLQWHDGELVTAEDVKFTFEYGAEVSPNVAGIAESIESIELEGDRTIIFNLDSPVASFETVTLAGRSSQIIPKHIWENVPDEVDAESATQWTNPNPVGSGPLQVDSFTLGEELQMSRFDAYGDAGFDTMNFEKSVRLQAPDIRTMVRQLEDETIDFIPYEIQVTDVQRFEQNDKYGLADSLMTSIHYVCYNMDRDLFADNEQGKAVRRAMAYALPKREAIEVATGGTAREIQTCFSRGLDYWYNEDVESFNFDLDAARSELESAGFRYNEDGRILYPE
jgi:peptide/nickel transport system substrate-binding protein